MIGRRSQGVPFYVHVKLGPILSAQCVHELGNEPGRMVGGNQFVQSRRQQPNLFPVHLSKRHSHSPRSAFSHKSTPRRKHRLLRQPHFCSAPCPKITPPLTPQRGLTMQITHQSRFRLLSALTVATLFAVVLVGCSDDPSPAPMDTTISSPTSTTAPAISNTPTSVPTSTVTAAPTNTRTPTPTRTATATPTNTPTSTPTSTATAAPTPTATPTPEPTPVVLEDCRDGMRLQPGEGCRYTGGGSPQANVVLSVQHDGAICREGGAAKREIGSTTLNMAST